MVDFIQSLQEGLNSGNSVKWYNSQVTNLVNNKNKKMFKKTTQPEIGKMFIYVYDPKTKATLPFYDMFPLIIPISFDNSGFLALNLHYLPPISRAGLLSSLMSISNNNKYNENTKLMISYSLLKQSSVKFFGYKECIKRYLYGYVRSSFHQIDGGDWQKVVMLPLQKWKINPNQKYAKVPPY